jgi:dihydrofolate reductase
MISLIAAIGLNNEIGKNNGLLWDMPADMKHFRETTSGHPVIMGQRTFESLGTGPNGEPGRPLPKRRNIVMTTDQAFKREGVEVVHSVEELLDLIKNTTEQKEEVFVIGGGKVYSLMMEYADRLYITHVGKSFPDADTFFPEIIPIVWNEVSHEEYQADEKNPCPYTFSVYERF